MRQIFFFTWLCYSESLLYENVAENTINFDKANKASSDCSEFIFALNTGNFSVIREMLANQIVTEKLIKYIDPIEGDTILMIAATRNRDEVCSFNSKIMPSLNLNLQAIHLLLLEGADPDGDCL